MSTSKKISLLLLFAALLVTGRAFANPEASDKAWEMANRQNFSNFYFNPSYEGHAGYATTLEFTIRVAVGIDYIFILAGDRYCQDVNVWIESENGNTLVKDTRKSGLGLCGVRWRSDYNGTVTVVVHFARVSSRCGWAALIGRRPTLKHDIPEEEKPLPAPRRGVSGQSEKPPGEANKPE